MMEVSSWWIAVLFVAVIVHEFAHYIDAKIQGVYKGWGLIPTPHIKLNGLYKNRISYLNGIILSFITLPLWLMVGMTILWTSLFLVVIGLGDIISFCVYGTQYCASEVPKGWKELNLFGIVICYKNDKELRESVKDGKQ